MKAARLLIAFILAFAAACATRPVTLHGAEVTDSFAVNTANRLADLETTLTTTGELLLAARLHFTNEQWDQIADTSRAASDALLVAKASLDAYIVKVNAGAAAGVERDALTKSIDVLTFLATTYVAYKGGGS